MKTVKGKKRFPWKKNFPKKNSKLRFSFAGVFLLVLILGAFILPVLTLHFQDMQTMDEVHFGFRTSLDYTISYPEYETVLVRRLTNFALGIAEDREFYGISSGYADEGDVALHEELQSAFSKVANIGLFLPVLMDENKQEYRNYQILEQEYFVIYDEEYIDRVAFLCLYLRLYINNSHYLELLMDGRDQTIYHMKIYGVDDDYLSTYIRRYGYEIFYFFPYFYQSEEWLEVFSTSRETETSDSTIYFNERSWQQWEDRVDPMNIHLIYGGEKLTLVGSIEREGDKVVSLTVGIQEIRELIWHLLPPQF